MILQLAGKNPFVFVKVLPEIKVVSRSDECGFRAVANVLVAHSLLFQIWTATKNLSDDTLYSRYGVYVVATETLEGIVRSTYPIVEATPAGYFVRLYGDKIRARRHKLGVSIGELAWMAGVSSGSLYGYEGELTRASVSVAYKITEIREVQLAKTINALKKTKTVLDRNFFNIQRTACKLGFSE